MGELTAAGPRPKKTDIKTIETLWAVVRVTFNPS